MTTVLVMENDHANAVLFRYILEPAGYAVTVVGSPPAARDVITARRVDVFVTDMRMVGNGASMLAWIGEHYPDLLARTIVVTADWYTAPHHGVGWLRKPFHRDDLLAAVAAASAGAAG